jgi:hypothetical protein
MAKAVEGGAPYPPSTGANDGENSDETSFIRCEVFFCAASRRLVMFPSSAWRNPSCSSRASSPRGSAASAMQTSSALLYLPASGPDGINVNTPFLFVVAAMCPVLYCAVCLFFEKKTKRKKKKKKRGKKERREGTHTRARAMSRLLKLLQPKKKRDLHTCYEIQGEIGR